MKKQGVQGRANQALTYRNKFGPLHLGGQLQMRSIEKRVPFRWIRLQCAIRSLERSKGRSHLQQGVFTLGIRLDLRRSWEKKL